MIMLAGCLGILVNLVLYCIMGCHTWHDRCLVCVGLGVSNWYVTSQAVVSLWPMGGSGIVIVIQMYLNERRCRK